MNESYFFTTELCVGYDRTPVVKNITITLERGEILTLIGPNGAGKSEHCRAAAAAGGRALPECTGSGWNAAGDTGQTDVCTADGMAAGRAYDL